jgi:hypothetical protein
MMVRVQHPQSLLHKHYCYISYIKLDAVTTIPTQRLRYGVDGSGSTYVIGVPKAQALRLTGLLPSTILSMESER